jgi:EAL and modified HD-GYP domain-containing signal transduction protein
MDIYTARQPILNSKSKVVAYELLYRDGEKNAFPDISPDEATTRLILNTHLNSGLKTISGGKTVFINFTESCLNKGIVEMLPPKDVVVELLESVEPTDEVYEKCRELYHKGYRFALDDFVYKKEWNRFLHFVRIIKIDIRQTPLSKIAPFIRKVHELMATKRIKNKIFFLAEKVETLEEFEEAKQLGFSYFQGYFFAKPEIKKQRDISFKNASVLHLYHELSKKVLDIKAISKIFSMDAGLTYKLLLHINSGLFDIVNKITSVRQALVYLGEKEVRRFLVLLATAELGKNKPVELLKMGTIRARACENTANKVAKGMVDEAFLCGMLSVLPAILDRSMEDVLEKIGVSEEIEEALSSNPKSRKNVLRIILEAVQHREKGSWYLATRECSKLLLDYDVFCDFYEEAVRWAETHEVKDVV